MNVRAVLPTNPKRDFSQFEVPYGAAFCAELSKAWKRFDSEPQATEYTYWITLKTEILEPISSSNDAQFKALVAHWNGSAPLEFSVLQLTALTVFASLRASIKEDRSLAQVTKTNRASHIRTCLDVMANAGLVPHGIPFQGFKITPKIGTGSTFLDVRLEASLNESQLQLLQETIEDDSKHQGEIKKLLENILAEVENVDSTGALDVLSLSAQTLQDRIDRIKSHCQQIYFDYIEATNEAKGWAENPTYIDQAAKLDKVISNEGSEIKNEVQGFGLEAFVTYLIKHNHGRAMTEKTPGYPRWSQAFSHAELHPSEFQNYIGVSTRAMVAGYAIILFETAANPEAFGS